MVKIELDAWEVKMLERFAKQRVGELTRALERREKFGYKPMPIVDERHRKYSRLVEKFKEAMEDGTD